MKEEHHMEEKHQTREGSKEKHHMEEEHHMIHMEEHYVDINTSMEER
jgi:hypothetical protein